MKSLPSSESPVTLVDACSARDRRNCRKAHAWCASLLLTLLSIGPASAQVGNGSPTGPAGAFNGLVTSGGAYAPDTGNVRRSIVDLEVPGAVHPLIFARTMNSRSPADPKYRFGSAGGWSHTYSWSMDDTEVQDHPVTQPASYTVHFPDGPSIVFNADGNPPAGVPERFVPLNLNTYEAALLLPDGGQIVFGAIRNDLPTTSDDIRQRYFFSYFAKAIIDPHGIRTRLSTATIIHPDGTRDARLETVTEPGGRTISLFYSTVGAETVIARIRSSDGREVQYNYSPVTYGLNTYPKLDSVVYPHEPTLGISPTASYTYTTSNVPDANTTDQFTGPPLLKTADDPMYAGAMKKISYEYATTNGDPMVKVAHGQIRSENNGTTGEMVSRLNVPFITWRSETRGDGPSRTFIYDGAFLRDEYDFKNQFTRNTYLNSLLAAVTDRNGQKTDFADHHPTTRVPRLITYPDTPSDGGARASVQLTYGGPNWPDTLFLHSVRDERNHTTTYWRDANKRVSQINYPDGGFETFTYNGFGQVLTHRMTSGGTETFEYDDSNGRLLAYRDPYHFAPGAPSWRYQYDARGRVSGMTDARGGYTGDPAHTTTFEYTERGQLRKTIHPTDPDTGQRYSVENFYNVDGTLRATTNERNHTVRYEYDDYKRMTKSFDARNKETRYEYTRWGTSSSYLHTNSPVFRRITPMQKLFDLDVDENFRVKVRRDAPFTADDAMTWFTYDAVGNLKTVKDPRDKTTTYFYDGRNRLTDVDDPISANRNSKGHTVSWMYDPASNKKSELRANSQLVSYDLYDQMNRLRLQTVQRESGITDVTEMTYDLAGNLKSMIDPRLKVYRYDYDLLNRKTHNHYPPDSSGIARQEVFTWDGIGNVRQFTNRGGAVQTFEHDNRNRERRNWWNTDGNLYRDIRYDPASNPVWIGNYSGDVDFSYDENNQMLSDTQINHANWQSRRVSYTYDDDRNRGTIEYPQGDPNIYKYSYTYNLRQQLAQLTDTGDTVRPPVVKYGYDPAGNRTRRELRNGTRTEYTPDDINRVPLLQHFLTGQTPRFDYGFDVMSRRTFEQRNSGSADSYRYDLSGQVTGFNRDGTRQTDGTVAGGANVLSIGYDPNGNRTFASDAAVSSGTGLAATYFDNNNFTGPTVSRIDATVDFNWGQGSPDPAIGPDDFSVRWEGQVVPRYSQTYTFYTQSDDGVRLWVNGQLLVDDWNYHWTQERAASIFLEAGRKYDIKVEYFEGGIDAVMKLLWSSASEPKQVIPKSQLHTPAGYVPNDLNQYTQARGIAAGYDVRGNLTSYNGWTYSYDDLNRLRAADNNTANIHVLYHYDGLNRQIANDITQNGVTTSTLNVWDGWHLLQEWNGGTLKHNYIHGAATDEVVVRFAGGYATRWYHYDGRSNVSHLSDDAGTLIERYTYGLNGDPFIYNNYGQQIATSPSGNRFFFQGRDYSHQTGLYDFRNRFYHPGLNRFMQPDPIGFAGDASNIYRFVGNNAVNHSDPSGLTIEEFFRRIFQSNVPRSVTTPGITVTATYIREPGTGFTAGDRVGGAGSNSGGDSGRGSGGERDKNNAEDKKEPCPEGPAAPAGHSVDANIRATLDFRKTSMAAATSAGERFAAFAGVAMWFKQQVTHRGPWDYKRLTPDLRYENFGNFNYGATGAAAGFDALTLHSEAGKVQAIPLGMSSKPAEWGQPYGNYPYGDEPKDAAQIAAGIAYYNRKYVTKDCE